ncbi:hypothetical protein Dsin_031685 [Dipteronia sinensis]|uniref:Uncharacterized protein n=1 Tax=Dipteronia sinensis TaxID=43782 RepID=A0AAE0DSK7_9ROSI|nr:hypothetical protein Dsin_031685 [Dipteronia sinensis]
MGKGIVGIQGPLYEGMGCFHRRKVIYGPCPNDLVSKEKGKLSENDKLVRELGVSKEFIKSTGDAFGGIQLIVLQATFQTLLRQHTKLQIVTTNLVLTGVKVQEPLSMCIPVALFVIYNLHTLSEYLETGFSIKSWWTSQITTRITTTGAWLFAVSSLILELFGLSDTDTVFEVTQKDHESSSSNDHGLISFDESSMFIPSTTMVLVQLTALATCSLGLQPPGGGGQGSGLAELLCSVFVVLCFWPFVEGLFRKGKFGIPLSTIFKSAALASLFVCF